MITENEWIRKFCPEENTFVEAVECDLALSLQCRSTDVEVVRGLLQHADKRLRGCAAWALNELPKDILSDYLSAIYLGFDDPYADVRYWCVLAVRRASDTHRTEAIVRTLARLTDDEPSVRNVAAMSIHALGRLHFERALTADPAVFGMSSENAATTLWIQNDLRKGYGHSLLTRGTCGDSGELLQGLVQLGYAIGACFYWEETVDSMKTHLHALSPDVRYYLADRLQKSVKAGVETVRSLMADSDARLRALSWNALSRIAREVRRCQEQIPVAADDVDKTVRKWCFRNLTNEMPREVIAAVIGACGSLSDDGRRDGALEALRNMTQAAKAITAIDHETLRVLFLALDDSSLPKRTRQDILEVLQDFGKIFLRDKGGFDWSAVLARTSTDAE